MSSQIELALKWMTVTIQMWTDLISSSSHSTAVIAEAIEVDNTKPLNSFSLLKLKYSSVTCAYINKNFIVFSIHIKTFCVINFRGFYYPQIFFNNELFPDYDTVYSVTDFFSIWRPEVHWHSFLFNIAIIQIIQSPMAGEQKVVDYWL